MSHRFLGLLLLVLSCSSPTREKLSSGPVIDEVRKMLVDYHHAIDSGGLMAEFDYLDSSDEFFWVPPGYDAPLNYDSVQTILRQNAGGFSSIELKWDTLQVFPLSAEIPTYAGIVSGWMTDTTGTKSFSRLLESGTLIKRANGWKLLSGQTRALKIENQNP